MTAILLTMSDGLVNVISNETRHKIKRDFPFVPGAWIEIYDDLLWGQVTDAKKMVETNDIDLDFVIPQITDWNFAGEDGKKLPITKESLKLFSTKKIQWFAKTIFDSLKEAQEEEKKSTA